MQTDDFPWARKAEHYIASGQKARALRLLDHVIEYDMPLFGDDPTLQEDRRPAWLYRIALLREWGRLSEALAWTCLECELNPGNVAALALKESLKNSLNLHGGNRGSDVKRRRSSVKPVIRQGVAGMREVKALLERDVILISFMLSRTLWHEVIHIKVFIKHESVQFMEACAIYEGCPLIQPFLPKLKGRIYRISDFGLRIADLRKHRPCYKIRCLEMCCSWEF